MTSILSRGVGSYGLIRCSEKILKYFDDNGYEWIVEYLKYEVSNWYFKPAEEN